jgi:ABC-type lipoprotein export system ATPase subunit/ABC-type multidrug transport system permease subunit
VLTLFPGPRENILDYFREVGYVCPNSVDIADFLQEIPTAEGARYINKMSGTRVPRTTESLAQAWKTSELFANMQREIQLIDGGRLHEVLETYKDPEAGEAKKEENPPGTIPPYQWPADFLEPYAGSFWFHFKLTLQRQITLTVRDQSFIRSRIGQRLIVGAIAGSLFSNIAVDDISTMNGFLFFTVLFSALSAFPMMPLTFAQKAVYYKHSDARFYPTVVYIAAQSLVLIPLFVLEACIFCSIMYWSAGLSSEVRGSRFLTFVLINLAFAFTNSQLFRLFACIFPDATVANPIAGIVVVLMVLFSGFIQPKSQISYGWVWFYWINPTSWALSAVTINEFKSTAYSKPICLNTACTESDRYGDVVLEQYGNKIYGRWIWYSLAVLIGLFCLYFFASFLALKYLRMESAKPLPLKSSVSDDDQEFNPEASTIVNADACAPNRSNHAPNGESPRERSRTADAQDNKGNYLVAPTRVPAPVDGITKASSATMSGGDVPFTPVTLAFKEIFYTVTLKGGEELDLLKNVSGFFKPGTVTALMGSSGAGKTTLLDVLSGRKNSGRIEGGIYVNGEPKEEHSFRAIMGYVEQFESLSPHDTTREAIAFSAALRLPPATTTEARDAWVNSVIDMLELGPIEDAMIGWTDKGGMSFEQKKRLSIGVELAANPSILFLDEPTTGLDSRAAQIVMRSSKCSLSSMSDLFDERFIYLS